MHATAGVGGSPVCEEEDRRVNKKHGDAIVEKAQYIKRMSSAHTRRGCVLSVTGTKYVITGHSVPTFLRAKAEKKPKQERILF